MSDGNSGADITLLLQEWQNSSREAFERWAIAKGSLHRELSAGPAKAS